MAGSRRAARRCARLALPVLLVLLAACAGRPEHPSPQPEGDVVPVPLAGIGPGSGRFFSYRSSTGGRAAYFVYREHDGTAHAVLDACRECYRWKKGYALEGDRVVCVKCGMAFRIDDLARGTGSCSPIPLRGAAVGERFLIPLSDLEAATRFF